MADARGIERRRTRDAHGDARLRFQPTDAGDARFRGHARTPDESRLGRDHRVDARERRHGCERTRGSTSSVRFSDGVARVASAGMPRDARVSASLSSPETRARRCLDDPRVRFLTPADEPDENSPVASHRRALPRRRRPLRGRLPGQAGPRFLLLLLRALPSETSKVTTTATAILPCAAVEGPGCGLVALGAAARGVETSGLEWNLSLPAGKGRTRKGGAAEEGEGGSPALEMGGLQSTSNSILEGGRVTVTSTAPLLWTTTLREEWR